MILVHNDDTMQPMMVASEPPPHRMILFFTLLATSFIIVEIDAYTSIQNTFNFILHKFVSFRRIPL